MSGTKSMSGVRRRAKTPGRLDRAVERLRAHRSQLRDLGVVHAGVFGSVARDQAISKSDIDVFAVLDESRHLSVYDFVGIRHFLQDILDRRVNLVERDAMKPRVRERALADAVDAF